MRCRPRWRVAGCGVGRVGGLMCASRPRGVPGLHPGVEARGAPPRGRGAWGRGAWGSAPGQKGSWANVAIRWPRGGVPALRCRPRVGVAFCPRCRGSVGPGAKGGTCAWAKVALAALAAWLVQRRTSSSSPLTRSAMPFTTSAFRISEGPWGAGVSKRRGALGKKALGGNGAPTSLSFLVLRERTESMRQNGTCDLC